MKRMLSKKALLGAFFISMVWVSSFAQQPVPKSIAITSAHGDLSPCVQMLNEGLRNVYVTVDKVSFFSDSRRYFLSEEFRNDYRSGKWNGGISVILDGTPLGLNAGASENEVKGFQKRVEEATSVVVQLETYSTISRSTVDIGLAEQFRKCLDDERNFGLSIKAEGKESVSVTIEYKPLSPDDSKPYIASVDLIGLEEADKAALLSGRLKKGALLKKAISFTAKRKPNEEFLIAVNLSNGLTYVKRLEGEDNAINGASPVGTIIVSALNFDAFSKMTNSDGTSGLWSYKSKWAPCDGRSVVGSRYHIWGGANANVVPDLRGAFVRGLNQFDANEPTRVSSEQANPDNTLPRTFQADAFQGHKHFDAANVMSSKNNDDLPNEPDKRPYWNNVPNSAGVYDAGYGKPRVSKETRPKNVSLYYYIRIN